MEKNYVIKIYDNDSENAIPLVTFENLKSLTFTEMKQKRYDGKTKYTVKITAGAMKDYDDGLDHFDPKNRTW